MFKLYFLENEVLIEKILFYIFGLFPRVWKSAALTEFFNIKFTVF